MQTTMMDNAAMWDVENDSHGLPSADEAAAMLCDEFVFEGPEKKLEVFFSSSPTVAAGLRSFDEPVWSELLTAARCTILHRQSSAAFDAYLLSESSMFVYPSRVILKTCGTTTLLLVLPRLLELAAQIGVTLEHAHYSHFRYKFPEQQVYPHTSFADEQRCLASLLEGHVAAVHAKVIGDHDATCWYALCTEAPLPVADAAGSAGSGALGVSVGGGALAGAVAEDSAGASLAVSLEESSSLPAAVDDLFEVAMEGLDEAVCALFFESHPAHKGASGRALARSMTDASGIGTVLVGVDIDDWAFEPCGYSMNGSRGAYYYTIHITPEAGFSYASFETNDPAFRRPERVSAVVGIFAPSTCTVTLTTRRARCELPVYELSGLERTLHERVHLDTRGEVSVCCLGFAAAGVPPTVASVVAKSRREVVGGNFDGAVGVGAAVDRDAVDRDATGSEASSEDTQEHAQELVTELTQEA